MTGPFIDSATAEALCAELLALRDAANADIVGEPLLTPGWCDAHDARRRARDALAALTDGLATHVAALLGAGDSVLFAAEHAGKGWSDVIGALATLEAAQGAAAAFLAERLRGA